VAFIRSFSPIFPARASFSVFVPLDDHRHRHFSQPLGAAQPQPASPPFDLQVEKLLAGPGMPRKLQTQLVFEFDRQPLAPPCGTQERPTATVTVPFHPPTLLLQVEPQGGAGAGNLYPQLVCRRRWAGAKNESHAASKAEKERVQYNLPHLLHLKGLWFGCRG